ncbi:MAG: 23S rRNA (uracil(1939)-C(5))-methyltransferase RlmD [Limnochordales bacterium]|nr:23S rRNA (uracil(1939)-C(5))-methyltransferase RlmD [Limnochordales bacterium]
MPIASGDRVTLDVKAVTRDGIGLAERDGVLFFLPGALPGEEVVAEVEKITAFRRRHRPYAALLAARPDSFAFQATARLVDVVRPSDARQTPLCPHFSTCGGCTWQHQEYSVQLAQKRALVVAALRPALEAAGLAEEQIDTMVRPVIPSPSPWRYRNKLEFTFSPTGWPGFHQRGDFRRLVELQECQIGSPEMIAAAKIVGEWAQAHGLPGYDKVRNTGFLRHLVVRQAYHTQELMVALETFTPAKLPVVPAPAADPALPVAALPFAEDLVARLTQELPHLTSLLWVINPSPSDVVKVEPGQLHVLWGRPYILEKLAGLTFRIELPTFFQTNTQQAETLIRLAREGAQLRPSDLLFDLYCGVGTFSLALARECRHVLGIELVEEAVEAARANAALNGITNVTFRAGDTRRQLAVALRDPGNPDVVLLDPPRAGAGRRVMTALARANPRRVVYVSCNPETLGSDLLELIPFGYTIQSVQPVDLFPHTSHVETVAVAVRSATTAG